MFFVFNDLLTDLEAKTMVCVHKWKYLPILTGNCKWTLNTFGRVVRVIQFIGQTTGENHNADPRLHICISYLRRSIPRSDTGGSTSSKPSAKNCPRMQRLEYHNHGGALIHRPWMLSTKHKKDDLPISTYTIRPTVVLQ